MARIKPPHRRRILLELDLTEIPVELDQDDPLARLRHRGRHDLRSTLRALHEAADDPRVVGLIAKVGGALPVAGHAGAAAGRAGLRRRRQADPGLGRDVRRGNRGRWPATCWRRRSTSCGSSPAASSACSASAWRPRSSAARSTSWASSRSSTSGTSSRTRQIRSCGPSSPRRTAPRSTGSSESVFDDAVEAIAQGRGLDPAVVRALVDGGPHQAARRRDAGLVDRLGYRDQALRGDADAARRRAPSCCSPTAGGPAAGRTSRGRRRGHVALVAGPRHDRLRTLPARPDGSDRGQRHGGRRPARGGRGRPGAGRRAARGLPGRVRGGLRDDLAGGHAAAARPSRSSSRWARSRRPAATTSPARPIASSPCRPP